MFEVDPSIGLAGAASMARADAASNARIAASKARLADRFEAAYEDWRAYAKKLEAEVEALKLALAVERADAGGMKAWKDAFRAAHPSSPVEADTGRRFRKSGNVKTRGRLAYEAEFDRIFGDARIPGRHATEFRAD